MGLPKTKYVKVIREFINLFREQVEIVFKVIVFLGGCSNKLD